MVRRRRGHSMKYFNQNYIYIIHFSEHKAIKYKLHYIVDINAKGLGNKFL